MGPVPGTALERLFPPAVCAQLRVGGVETLEELVSVTDGNLANLGLDARRFRSRATEFLQKKMDVK